MGLGRDVRWHGRTRRTTCHTTPTGRICVKPVFRGYAGRMYESLFGPPEPEATPKRICATCHETADHDDDFCHECGHDLEWTGGGSGASEDEESGQLCPACGYGELRPSAMGHPQCESCGHTTRDWSE